MDCVWNGVSGVACVKIAGFVWHLHIENKYFVCERVSVRSFDGCEIFRIFTLMKKN